MNIKCNNCKKEFECENKRYNWSVKNNKPLYCSKKCFHKSRVGRIIDKCYTCNKSISRQLNQVKKSKSGKLFCSKSCSVSFNNKLRIWEDHPNFKHGIGSYRNRKLQISKMECERCKISDKRVLQVHHKDQNRKNNKIENLELLCANCHLIEHYQGRIID